MNARHTLATWLVILLMTIGASSEIVYSGVKNIAIGPFGTGGQLDVDADGTADFETRRDNWVTNSYPTSGWGGYVDLRLLGETRVLVTSNDIGVPSLGALPHAFSVGAQPQGFGWIGTDKARYGVLVGSWSEGLNQPWSGWTGFAGAEDPVFGIELHSSIGVRYGWMRLRFGSGTGNSSVHIYDWAYESAPGVAIVARAGTDGVITPPPPFPVVRGLETFGAWLSGTKAVPPSSSPLIGTAELALTGEQLMCAVAFPSEAFDPKFAIAITAVLESAEEQRSFPIYHLTISTASSQGTGTIVIGNPVDNVICYSNTIDLTPSLAQALRLGNVHLKLALASGEIRGQVARPLAKNNLPEPPLAGEYSLLLWPPAEEASTVNRRFPKGVGHGRLRISDNREVSLTATLPLGPGIRCNGILDETNSIHVTANEPRGRGSVAGEIRLELRGGDWVCKGELLWTRPADSERLRFPGGFEIPLRVEGSRFDRNKERATNCTLTLSRGGLGSPITVALKSLVEVTDLNGGETQRSYSLEVAGSNPHRVAINADPETGVFRGSFRYPKTRVRVPFAGRLLGDLSGGGSFLSGRGTGAVTINGLAPGEQPTLTFVIPPIFTPALLIGPATLTPSSSDPDVVIVAASGMVPDTSYEVELIPLGIPTFGDGIYDVVLNRYRAREIGLMVITTASTTSVFLRPPGFKGIRIHHEGGSVTLFE